MFFRSRRFFRRKAGAKRARHLPRSSKKLIVIRRRFKPGTKIRDIQTFNRPLRQELDKRPLAVALRPRSIKRAVNSHFFHDAGFAERPIMQAMEIFNNYRHPIRCIKRRMRKEVLFALGVAGRHGKSPGKGGSYRRTSDSNLGC